MDIEQITDEVIGSLFIIGFEGTSLNDFDVEITLNYAKDYNLGGIILYARNVHSPAQLQNLTKAFKDVNPSIFISVDQEGGKVQRLNEKNGFKNFPSAHNISETITPINAYNLVFKPIALMLSTYSINLNFAPVVDVNNKENPCDVIGKLERSYSDDPNIVTEYAREFIKAHNEYGIASCIKHFPGHGYALYDSHHAQVDVTDTYNEKETVPFMKLIKEAPMIMTAHIINKNFDDKFPATLSPTFLKNELREKGYDNIIISDDLHMGSILNSFDISKAIILALNAGCDMLILSNNPSANKFPGFKYDNNAFLQALSTVKEALALKLIEPTRITEAYERIQKLKNMISSKDYCSTLQ